MIKIYIYSTFSGENEHYHTFSSKLFCVFFLQQQRHVPLVLGFLFLTLPFLPATNLVVTVGFVVAERVLYIPR
jgi:hypothetical protein